MPAVKPVIVICPKPFVETVKAGCAMLFLFEFIVYTVFAFNP